MRTFPTGNRSEATVPVLASVDRLGERQRERCGLEKKSAIHLAECAGRRIGVRLRELLRDGTFLGVGELPWQTAAL
jgi:hypothetical protein